MSTSTRNRRATVYPLVGRSSGGFVTSTYGVARGTYWCRFSPVPGDESTIDAQIGISARGILEFADEVPVAEHDLVVLDDDTPWKAGAITERRTQRALILRIERSTETAELPIDQTPPAAADSHTDGSHSDQSYDAPGDAGIDAGGAAQVVTATIDAGGA